MFRADSNPDSSLPWFQLVEGKFPPEDSAHAISGELIQMDHLERCFRLRVDRSDSQQAGYMDLPLESEMLPYGSIFYHGAPAAQLSTLANSKLRLTECLARLVHTMQ